MEALEPKDWSKSKIFDIAANMTDPTFRGIYRGKQAHVDDYDHVIQRARNYGVQKFLYAAGHLDDAFESLKLCEGNSDAFATIGVHPCRATEPFKDKTPDQHEEALNEYFKQIESVLADHNLKNRIVAVGECGLDYDRFEYADKETQLKVFPRHFELTEKFNLPMYLHSRATGQEFNDIIKENRSRFPGGVVHSFTGTEEELQQLLAMDLYIGLNGCSLKTEQNCAVAAQVPLDRLMLETDCPYCDIRNSHHSSQFVKTKFEKKDKKKYKPEALCKDRNEPCTIVQVVEVLSALKGVSEDEICEVAWKNSMALFKLN